MAGIANPDIQTSVQEMEGVEAKPLNDILALVEIKERARKAYRTVDVSAVSEYKRNKTRGPSGGSKAAPLRSKKAVCLDCHEFSRAFYAKYVSPFRNCFSCYKKSLF